MAKRNIKTVIAVEGEKAYKAAIASINSEMKVLQTELSLSESKFKGNANSMAALVDKGKALHQMHDAQAAKVEKLRNALESCRKAQEAYNLQIAKAKSKIEENERKLEALKNTKGDTKEEQDSLTESIKKNNNELAKAEAGLESAKKRENAWQVSLNKSQIEINSLTDEINKNARYQREASKADDGRAVSIDNFGIEVRKTAGELINAAGAVSEFGEKADEALGAMAANIQASGIAKGEAWACRRGHLGIY